MNDNIIKSVIEHNGWFCINTTEEEFNEIDENKEGCYFCNYKKILIPHHIIRKCDGGLDNSSNILLICPNCHSLIHSYKYFLRYCNGKYSLVNKKNIQNRIFREDAPYKTLPFGSITESIDKGRLIKTKNGYKLAIKQKKNKKKVCNESGVQS